MNKYVQCPGTLFSALVLKVPIDAKARIRAIGTEIPGTNRCPQETTSAASSSAIRASAALIARVTLSRERSDADAALRSRPRKAMAGMLAFDEINFLADFLSPAGIV